MDSSQPAQSILDTLRTVEFRLGLKGYNVEEVDDYLEKAALEAEALQEHVRQLNERLRQASDRIVQLETERREAPAPVPAPPPPPVEAAAELGVADEELQRTIVMAQRIVDQIKRESEAEAAEHVARAQEHARTTVSDAEERARTLTTEAEQNLRAEVTRLETARGQLANDVENMARHLESERNRLRAALSDVLKWVEENVQPANSLMALRPKATGAPGAPAGARPPEPARPSPRPVAATPPPVPPRPAVGSAPAASPRPSADSQHDTQALNLGMAPRSGQG